MTGAVLMKRDRQILDYAARGPLTAITAGKPPTRQKRFTAATGYAWTAVAAFADRPNGR
jgi:hypothetical protein